MFQDQLNARLAIKKSQELQLISPLERIAKSMQADVVSSNSFLVQKDWAKWNEEHAKNGIGGNLENPTAHKDSIPRGKRDEKNHQKELQSENWHTKTMASFRDKGNDSLKFIQRDAHEASKANPDNPKAGQYMDEVHYASMELAARAKHHAAKKSELVYKDWAAWNKAHPKGNYGALLPKHEVQGWNSQADQHKVAYNNHMASAQKLLSGTPERKAHSDAAVAHLQGYEHAKGVLAGTHNPETYSGSNYKAKQATVAAVDFKKNRSTANANNGSKGMFMSHGGMKFASEKRPYLG